MDKSIWLGAFAIVLLVTIPSLIASSADEYLTEFNNEGETCQIVDAFNYEIPSPTFFNSDHFASTVPVFYYCSTSESNILVVFDIYNRKFYDDNTLSDTIDLSYIRHNLNVGNLSDTNFIHSNIDVCNDLFGSDKLNQQSVNLAAKTIEAAKPLMTTQTAKDISTVIKIGKVAGTIKEFNPTTFVVSIGCNYNNKDLKRATETLAMCNAYLSNIGNGFTRYGYVNELSSCISTAKTTLKGYIDSPLSQVREVADTAYAHITALMVKPLSDFMQGKTPDLTNIKIEETEMSIARRIYNNLGNNQLNLKHPQKNSIINQEKARIMEKETTYTHSLARLQNKYDSVRKIQPNVLNIWFTGLLMTPSYNLSLGIESINNASQKISIGQTMYNQYKFNSAITALITADTDIDSANVTFTRENAVVRKIKWSHIMYAIIIAVIVAFITMKVILSWQNDEFQ